MPATWRLAGSLGATRALRVRHVAARLSPSPLPSPPLGPSPPPSPLRAVGQNQRSRSAWHRIPSPSLPGTTPFHRFTMASSAAAAASSSVVVEICKRSVPVLGEPGVSDEDVRRAVESTPFKQWAAHMEGPQGILTLGGSGGARCSLHSIIIQSVDMFGTRVGFVKFKADVRDDMTGAKLPGIIFARGGAVGILMLLTCGGDTFAVLTEQARVPVGRAILELPAGMLDEDAGDFVGTAAREVEEETGIKIKAADLIDLTAFLDKSTGGKMFPSPGGSDEDITLFLYRGTCRQELVDELRGAQRGLREHGELIQLHMVPYEDLWRTSADCKVLSAIALLEGAKKNGLLPDPPNAPRLS